MLPTTVTMMGLVESQGPRWIPVDDPKKSLEDEIFQYLHGNVYYSQQFDLAFGYHMVAFGSVSMTFDIDGPGGADVRMRPDGKMFIANSREKLNFVWNCFFAEVPFITKDGVLHPSLEKAWANERKGRWDERPIESYKPWESADKVDLEFVGQPKKTPGQKPKELPVTFSRRVSKGSGEFQEACADLGKQRHFESRNLNDDTDKRLFLRTLQSIVEQCYELQSRFPSETLDTSNMPSVRRIFYLPGPKG